MPFRVRLRSVKGNPDPELVPTPFCDFCGEPIPHVRDGVWLLAPDRYEAGDTAVLCAHHDRLDDRGDPVLRCHTGYEARERAAGRDTPGWLELGDLIEHLVVHFPGARKRAAAALDLHERDVWLMRWLAAGKPTGGLRGQPKKWDFEEADARLLADRLARSVAPGTPTSDTDDDFRYGQFGQDLPDASENSGPTPNEADDEPI